MDFGRCEIVHFAELFEEIIALVAEDAVFFDCVSEVDHAWTILARGTSAHRQIAAYHGALEAGAEPAEALRQVVDMLIAETVAGL